MRRLLPLAVLLAAFAVPGAARAAESVACTPVAVGHGYAVTSLEQSGAGCASARRLTQAFILHGGALGWTCTNSNRAHAPVHVRCARRGRGYVVRFAFAPVTPGGTPIVAPATPLSTDDLTECALPPPSRGYQIRDLLQVGAGCHAARQLTSTFIQHGPPPRWSCKVGPKDDPTISVLCRRHTLGWIVSFTYARAPVTTPAGRPVRTYTTDELRECALPAPARGFQIRDLLEVGIGCAAARDFTSAFIQHGPPPLWSCKVGPHDDPTISVLCRRRTFGYIVSFTYAKA